MKTTTKTEQELRAARYAARENGDAEAEAEALEAYERQAAQDPRWGAGPPRQAVRWH